MSNKRGHLLVIAVCILAFETVASARIEGGSEALEESELKKYGIRVLRADEIPADITNVVAEIGRSKWIHRSDVPSMFLEEGLRRLGRKTASGSRCETLEHALLLYINSTSLPHDPKTGKLGCMPTVCFELGEWLVFLYADDIKVETPVQCGGFAVKKGTRTMYSWSSVDQVLGKQRKSDGQVETETVLAELWKKRGFDAELIERAKKLLASGQASPPAIADDIAVMALGTFRRADDPEKVMAAYREFSPRMKDVSLAEDTVSKWARYQELREHLRELGGGDALLALFVKANVLGKLDEHVRGKGAKDKQADAIRSFVREEARKLVEEYREPPLKIMLQRMAAGKSAEFESEEQKNPRTGGESVGKD